MIPRQHCDGCLGSRSCWVCLGDGSLPTPFLTPVPCRRCVGTGRCSLCQQVAVVDLRPRHPADVEVEVEATA